MPARGFFFCNASFSPATSAPKARKYSASWAACWRGSCKPPGVCRKACARPCMPWKNGAAWPPSAWPPWMSPTTGPGSTTCCARRTARPSPTRRCSFWEKPAWVRICWPGASTRAAAGPEPLCPFIRPAFRSSFLKANSSGMKRVRLPELGGRSWAIWKWRTAARCLSTKWVRCLCPCRPSCSGFCRRNALCGWAASARSVLISGWWRPPTGTSKAWWLKGASGKISTIVFPWCPSPCRPCASVPPTFPCWRGASWRCSAAVTSAPCLPWKRKRRNACAPMPGPVMCGN